MLIERFDALLPFEARLTIRGGVFPLWFPGSEGELRLTILIPGALLGVSRSALPVLTERVNREALLCICLGGDDVTPSSAKSACVTLENLIAGGGSSSESLSSRRCIIIRGSGWYP